MKKQLLLSFLVILFAANLSAQQFDLSAELRPRYENKFGVQTLRVKGEEAGNFVSQRTRLNFDFKQDKLVFKASLQNVRVWGDVSTLSSDDNATALHEAWGEAILSEKISLKLGRQEIVYDDHRIFGNVGWAQQARSHDAFLAKFTPNPNHRIDVGLAYNADSQASLDAGYSNAAGYKTFQYAWYHGDFNKFGLSFLLLNTGKEFEDVDDNNKLTVDFMQTVGPRFTYKSGDFNANAAGYFQTGKGVDTDLNTTYDVSASYFAANLGYKINDNFSVGIGGELLSGTDMNDTSGKNKSFSPLFGTNHKFNGWMDYFYVGNPHNNVGLTDLNATISYKKNKISAKLIPHFFSTSADVIDGNGDKMEANLGTEIDIALGYKLSKTITLNAGYSKMFATDTMEAIKGGDKDVNNSWGWVMFTFKPKLFSYSPPPVE